MVTRLRGVERPARRRRAQDPTSKTVAYFKILGRASRRHRLRNRPAWWGEPIRMPRHHLFTIFMCRLRRDRERSSGLDLTYFAAEHRTRTCYRWIFRWDRTMWWGRATACRLICGEESPSVCCAPWTMRDD